MLINEKPIFTTILEKTLGYEICDLLNFFVELLDFEMFRVFSFILQTFITYM